VVFGKVAAACPARPACRGGYHAHAAVLFSAAVSPCLFCELNGWHSHPPGSLPFGHGHATTAWEVLNGEPGPTPRHKVVLPSPSGIEHVGGVMPVIAAQESASGAAFFDSFRSS